VWRLKQISIMNRVASPDRSGNKPLIILGAPQSGVGGLGQAAPGRSRSVTLDWTTAASAKGERAGVESVAALQSKRILQDLCIAGDMPLLLIRLNDNLAASGDFVVLRKFRVSLFLASWHEAWVLAKLNAFYWFIHGHHLGVSNSLRLKNKLGMPHRQQILLRYTLFSLEFLAHADKNRVICHRLIFIASSSELKAYQESCNYCSGNIMSAPYHKAKEVSDKTVGEKTRPVILHYHLFKNAGTSVDAVLKRNFGKLWEEVEFPPPGQEDHAKAIHGFIAERKNLVAVSSHTLSCPPPVFADVIVLPIVFVRQPLKRLRSAYEFERKQVADTAGAKLAKTTDFAGYLRTRLAVAGDRSCRNFQTYRLARLLPQDGRSERDRAFATLDQLPFVGLVEEFSKSMRKLKALVEPHIPSFQEFEAWENSTSTKRHGDGSSPSLSLKEELGDESYAMVLEANRDDIAIYEEVAHRYAKM
jgi:hypothetical protein